MYVDSMETQGAASEQEVAKLLREHMEPLLLVSITSMCNFERASVHFILQIFLGYLTGEGGRDASLCGPTVLTRY